MTTEYGFELISETNLVDLNYTDANMVFPITNRQIEIGDYFIVSGDNNAEIISFEHDKYMEGIDLSTKQVEIIFQRSDGHKNNIPGYNFRKSTDKVRFSWTINIEASAVPGPLLFIVRFYDNNYSLKTIDANLQVKESMSSEVAPETPVPGEVQYLTPNEVNEIILEVKTQIAIGGQ